MFHQKIGAKENMVTENISIKKKSSILDEDRSKYVFKASWIPVIHPPLAQVCKKVKVNSFARCCFKKRYPGKLRELVP